MRKLLVFNSISLDGYFTGENGDLGWAHRNDDEEWNSFVEANAKGGGQMLFGRVTYEMMASYWPTPAASEQNPVVAKRMNELPKVVFSRTLREASWSNAELLREDPVAAVRRMKREPGPGLLIFGSGQIIAQLAPAGLIDRYQFVVVPVVLGRGRTMFEGVGRQLPLRLTETRTFANGNVLHDYESMA